MWRCVLLVAVDEVELLHLEVSMTCLPPELTGAEWRPCTVL